MEKDTDRPLLLGLVTKALGSWGRSAEQLAPLITSDDIGEPGSALIEAAALLTGNTGLGIELAHRTAIRAETSLMYLLMSSPTLSVAIQHLVRYAPVAVNRPTRASLFIGKDAMTLYFGLNGSGANYAEFVATLLVRIFRYLVDDPGLKPVEVRFTHDPPSNLEPRREIFGPNLRFQEARNALVFSAEQIALRSAHASASLHALHEAALLQAQLAALEDVFVPRVREALDRHLGVGATIPRIARALGVSSRTLQRRLTERGTNFQRLVEEVRWRRTLELLSQPSISIEAVARAAGYRNASSFHRAFRAWTGVTPAVYRERMTEPR